MQRAACILPFRIRPSTAGDTLEVLLVQRAQALAVMAGFWALPGGQLDASDDERARKLGVPEHAWRLAALRELFEETGLVPPAATQLAEDARAQIRQDLLDRRLDASQALSSLGLDTPACLGQLMPCGHWQTPPFGPRRFMARYFALELSAANTLKLAPHELSAGLWLTPEAALLAHEHNDAYLAMPVRHTLMVLAGTRGTPRARMMASSARLEGEDLAARLTVGLADGVAMMPVKSPTLPPSTHTNCYVLGEGHLSIVDPGTPYPDETARLIAMLRARVERGEKLSQVWLTHHHPDHVGAAEALREAFGVPVWAHQKTSERLVGRVRIDRLIEDDDVLPVGGGSWRALYTPGHAPGHLCFYEQERGHLLAGDNVLGAGTSIVMPRPEGDMRAYMQSLERLSTLRLGLLLPGHGPPIATSLKRLGDTLAQRRARERLVQASIEYLLARNEAPTLSAIVGRVYRGLAASLRGLGELSTRAHLEKLVDDEALVRSGGSSDTEAQWHPA